jgi:hypothetical protein
MASMKSRFRPSHDAKLHMLAEPLGTIMRTLNILFLIVCLGCSKSDKKNNLNEQTTSTETSVDSAFTLITVNNPTIELSKAEKETVEKIKEFEPDNSIPFREFRKISNHSFDDSCKMIVMEIIILNNKDTIVHLIDKCEANVLGTLAAKYQYPDGSSSSKSRITGDTITTITKDNYLGEFHDDFYEVLTDSITIKKVLLEQRLTEIFKDSIRTTKKVKMKK